jgi:transcriptional regulator with XRE-family HTH domain
MAKKKSSEGTSIAQKKEHAKLLYLQGVTMQKELAERVGVSEQTISKWVNADDKQWDRMRQSTLITKESELRRFYEQLTELNDKIMDRPKGARYPDSKEADSQTKITASIRAMETETSLAEIMEVLKNFLVFTRQAQEPETVKLVTALADQFVKSNIR